MLQRSALPARPQRPQRPLYQEVRLLSDAQLSLMCHSHRIFPGQITFRNRRQAERQLHIALIEERARFRAREQFAEQCRLEHSDDPSFRPGPPPPQQHYDVRAVMPQPASPFPDYWPKPKSLSLRSNPPPSSSFQYRQEPVLEPRRYVSWQQQNRIYEHYDQKSFQTPAPVRAVVQAEARPEETEVNFLGFKLPFSLETAREITTKISDSLKRFQGVGESQAATRFEGGSIRHAQDRSHDEQRKSQAVARHSMPQCSYQAGTTDDRCTYASEEEYQADESEEEDLLMPDEDFTFPSSEECDQDTLSDLDEEKRQQQAYAHPLPFDFREMKTLADAQAQTELIERSSRASTDTTYHDFLSQEPLQRAADNIWWRWWWPQRATAGNERIPVSEQTREREHMHEHEVKSIDYLRDSTQAVDDGVMEIMRRVELRDDSEEEDLVVLPDGTLSTQPSPRTYVRFFRSIFQMLLCDQDAKLDPEKLRCAFIGCCMVFAVYIGYRMMR